MFRVETVAIGDELLTGRIADTNSAFVAGELYRHGLRLERTTVIPDDDAVIERTLAERAAHCEAIVCFGGLGPTSDDRTAAVVAKMTGGSLIEHPPSKEKLLRRYKERGREVTTAALKQVLYPDRTTPLENETGMAPGFCFDRGACRLYFLPGVPFEMRAIFAASVLPAIDAAAGRDGRLLTQTFQCLGLPESDLQTKMNPVEAALPKNAWLGYRTRFPENHLVIYWRRESEADDARMLELTERVRGILAPWIYTETGDAIETILLRALQARGARLALAESCTGGLGASRLASVAGASSSLWGSFVVYRTEAKRAMLGVDVADDVAAVSALTSRQLAEAARKSGDVEVGAAITGYLGPAGGTAVDPVGTLYVCVTDGTRFAEQRVMQRVMDREAMQNGAATVLLAAVHAFIVDKCSNN